MDLQMPVLDGYSATEAIRNLQEGKDVPIIALTAGATKEEREKCLSSGMNDFLTKPILKNVLIKTVHKYISSMSNK